MVRNDAYWGDKPKLRQVDVKFIAEASNRVQLLSKGEVGLALEVPPKDVQSLKDAEGVVIDSRASNKILFFAMNNKIKPFDDPRVRQAVSYAIPYDKLINDVMKGEASPMKSAVASSTPGSTDAGYTAKYDLDKARALLAEAGLSKGFSFDFTLGSGFDDWNDDAVLIQAELAKIGVTMHIKKMARPQFLEALETKKVQAYISRWTSFVNDPGYHLGLLLTSQGTSNYVNFSDPVVDRSWQQASTRAGRRQAHQAVRRGATGDQLQGAVGLPVRVQHRGRAPRRHRRLHVVPRWDRPLLPAERDQMSCGRKAVLAEIERTADELIELAGELIRIPSENPPGDCTEVGEFIAAVLRKAGVEVEILDAGQGRLNVVVAPGRAG